MNHIDLENKTVLVTGAAGFIGHAVCRRLLSEIKGINVIGIDNMNDYYDVRIKKVRLDELEKYDNFIFIKGNIANKRLVMSSFEQYNPIVVVNLAAQAGVRYSIEKPDTYMESNLVGFFNILEGCRYHHVEHFVYASSSSVYGNNKKVPYSVEDRADEPVSFYAATKRSNELMAYAYSTLYSIPSTGLRFFTVYGPLGRPDMAYFGFTDKLVRGEKIELFNNGNCERDFTYIDDVVEGIILVMQNAPGKADNKDNELSLPYALYNIGNSHPEKLLDFVEILQEELVKAGVIPPNFDFNVHRELVSMQLGDVQKTYADTSALERDFGFVPRTSLREGLKKFVEWYKSFYSCSK